ncbi:hypothetical protein N0V82_009076 [Gnomoniopsis sp. IMI 355080]|nr:hypothetical protein N0V82_009076 [Gnomoniopsis sp. IMI 355080]
MSFPRSEIGTVILKIVYGYNAEKTKNDPLIEMAGDAMDKFAKAAVPGAFMVDILPFFAALSTFFLAMVVNEDAQRKAQEEIDRVTGGERLPVAADRDSLNFVDAIVKETLRWGPVAPMNLPHTSTEDDVWEGHFIPKDAIIMANICLPIGRVRQGVRRRVALTKAFRHFTQDSSIYPEPMYFRPERFLKIVNHEPEPDPRDLVFGFGRRICPGRLLADTALFVNIAQTLAVFNISKPLDADGIEVAPEVRWEPGVVSHPAPYKAEVTSRGAGYAELIRKVEGKYPWQDSDAEVLNMIY